MTGKVPPYELGTWLNEFNDEDTRDRILEIGNLTGLKRHADGHRPANFERALVLDRLVEILRPRRVLELGTGRGLGCLALASAAEKHEVPMSITTVDIYDEETDQDWPLRIDGEDLNLATSRHDIWNRYFSPSFLGMIDQRCGKTHHVLRELADSGEGYDLIFIDAGHDLHSVVQDLVGATELLHPRGSVLMDDFSPLDDYGIGTCVAVAQAARIFEHVETFTSDGIVFGGSDRPSAPRGMALLSHPKKVTRNQTILPWYRFAASVLHRCYSSRFSPFKVNP